MNETETKTVKFSLADLSKVMKSSKLSETPFFFSVTIQDKVYMLAAASEELRSSWIKSIRGLSVCTFLSLSLSKCTYFNTFCLFLAESSRQESRCLDFNRIFGKEFEFTCYPIFSYDLCLIFFQQQDPLFAGGNGEQVNRFSTRDPQVNRTV